MCFNHKKDTTIAKIKVIELTDQQRLELEGGFRNGNSHVYRMRCREILLESITAEKVADFLDRMAMRIKKETFVVLDNASILSIN